MKSIYTSNFLLLSILVCPGLLTAQNIEWAFQAKGIGNAPIIPTVENNMARDGQNNIYICSSVSDSTQFGPFGINGSSLIPGVILDAPYVAKFSSAGQVLWVKVIKGAIATIHEIDVDASGNLYVTGIMRGTADFDSIRITTARNEMFLAKFNTQGAALWVRTSNGGAGASAFGHSVVVARNELIYVAGIMERTVTFQTIQLMATPARHFIAAYRPDGVIVWARAYGRYSQPGALPSIDTDTESNIYFAGGTDGTTVFDTISFDAKSGATVIAKFDQEGNVIWLEHTIPDVNNFSPFLPEALVVDHGGQALYVTGEFDKVLTFQNLTLQPPAACCEHFCLLKFNLDGQIQWARRSETGSSQKTKGFDLDINTAGDIFVVGIFWDGNERGISLGIGPNRVYLPNIGTVDGFLAKYKNNGDLTWVMPVAGTENDEVRNVVATGQNKAAVNGIMVDTLRIGDTVFVSMPVNFAGNYFLAAIDGDLSPHTGTQNPGFKEFALTIYPNPSDGRQLFINSEIILPYETEVLLFDLSGNLVHKNQLAGKTQITVPQHLAKGMYVLKLSSKSGFISKMIEIH